MSGFDAPTLHYPRTTSLPTTQATSTHRQHFYNFYKTYTTRRGLYKYRDALRANILAGTYALAINVGEFVEWEEQHAEEENTLSGEIVEAPERMIGFMEEAANQLAQEITQATPEIEEQTPRIQIILNSRAEPTYIRNLTAKHISKLVRLPGLIISATTLSAKATLLHMSDLASREWQFPEFARGRSSKSPVRRKDSSKCSRPRDQTNPDKDCPLDPYMIVHEKSTFIDQQILKMQETPEAVPVGEMPRQMQLTVDRYLCGKVTAGSRVTIVGIFSIFQDKAKRNEGAVAVRKPYIRVVGLDSEHQSGARGTVTFTDREEEDLLNLSRRPDIYDVFTGSIAPSIFGNDEMKKAVACLLVGGSRKQLPDGVRLRGDINVLLLGDPGTAKSQLLKFAQQVAPISVYTSGKGSSAAGLTASIIRDPASRDFILEGGAMVLADGGVVCIDEFDKMRDEDRVAIHEAMEQQTISIAKAGITTILNSRTSVLAAANPIFGRYDDTRSAGENIDFQSTILSRFDMIFIVRDEHNEARDIMLAKHVMNIHMNRAAPDLAAGELDVQTMRNYISYVKTRCAPRLSAEAGEKLSSDYVEIRKGISDMEGDTNTRSSIPITIRQLEAICRISEAVAKIQMSPTVNEAHVNEALRLFRLSTINAASAGETEARDHGTNFKEIEKIQKWLDQRLPLNSMMSERALVAELSEKGYAPYSVNKALTVLERKGVIQYRNERKKLFKSRML